MYPPYSSLNNFGDLGNNPGTTAFIAGILMLGASSTLSGVNFITTVFTLRARGVDLMKMPLFTWSVFVSVFILYVSLPAFVVGVAFLMLDHSLAAHSTHLEEARFCSSTCSGSLVSLKYMLS